MTPRYEIVQDRGRWYVMKGERIVTNGFATRALAQRWVDRLTPRKL